MNGTWTIYIDQWSNIFAASTVKGLRQQIANGGSRVSKQYVDKRAGGAVHNGYVIGPHWLTAYRPFEKPA